MTMPTEPYDNTVELLYNAARDVEMQDAFPVAHQSFLYVVLDTNVLIDYCGIIEHFCEDVERVKYPIMIIVPSVVLSELDGLKNREDLQWFARQATTWLLKKVKERTTVKLQAMKETQSPGPRAESDHPRKNDLAIRDCCLYFGESSRGYGALMVTLDKNLALECHKEGLETYIPPRRSWSSRLLAQHLPVPGVDLTKFRDREAFPRYRPSRSKDDNVKPERLAQTEGPTSTHLAIADDDRMDVDEGGDESTTLPQEYIPLHARDSLHAQMAEHFTLVLKDLAHRLHMEYRDSLAVQTSAHAPAYRRTELARWTAGLCLSYLQTKRAFQYEAWMASFFSRRGEDGWRRGQDWSPAMWAKALNMLEKVGRKFDDGALLSSIAAVRPHVQEVWDAKLAPN
ncbi:PIN domain-containing protein [Cerioporus squamosus]|nr:PIN domain-containing protein [Cerioporus squamosus]